MATKTKYPRENCEVTYWFERDRARISVTCDGEDVIDWWDDAVYELEYDGFIDLGAFMGYDGPRVNRDMADASILDYCEELGLIS